MHYVVNLSVPINTLASAPVKAALDIPERTIQALQVDFLTSTYGAVGVRVLDRAKPIWPGVNSPGAWIVGSGLVTALPDDISLGGSPYRINIEAYNTNTTGSAATIQLRFVVVTMTIGTAIFGLLELISRAVDHFVRKPVIKESDK